MSCRICDSAIHDVLDLGASPPANALKARRDDDQPSYPLVLQWCERCNNVQLRDCLPAEALYQDYLYVTPRSKSLEDHYQQLAAFLERGGYLGPQSVVMEMGSNIGRFLEAIKPKVRGVLGIDPARQIAEQANAEGIPTMCDFFHPASARKAVERVGAAQLVVARHCLAHNEWPQEMIRGAAAALSAGGHLVIENAYLLNTIENAEFDQIYHEHMFYYSVHAMREMLRREGFSLVDLMFSPVHGGSIAFIAKLGPGAAKEIVATQLEREAAVLTAETFARLRQTTARIKSELLALVGQLTSQGKSIYTYGATAKGNTLLNYVGLSSEQIPYCVDSTPGKHGRFLPKTNIEVISEERGLAAPPDYFLLTAWNYRDEIIDKVRRSGNRATRFIVPMPSVAIVDGR